MLGGINTLISLGALISSVTLVDLANAQLGVSPVGSRGRQSEPRISRASTIRASVGGFDNTGTRMRSVTPNRLLKNPAKGKGVAKKGKGKKGVAAKKKPVKGKKTPVKGKKTPVKSKKTPVKSKKTPVKGKGKKAVTKNKVESPENVSISQIPSLMKVRLTRDVIIEAAEKAAQMAKTLKSDETTTIEVPQHGISRETVIQDKQAAYELGRLHEREAKYVVREELPAEGLPAPNATPVTQAVQYSLNQPIIQPSFQDEFPLQQIQNVNQQPQQQEQQQPQQEQQQPITYQPQQQQEQQQPITYQPQQQQEQQQQQPITYQQEQQQPITYQPQQQSIAYQPQMVVEKKTPQIPQQYSALRNIKNKITYDTPRSIPPAGSVEFVIQTCPACGSEKGTQNYPIDNTYSIAEPQRQRQANLNYQELPKNESPQIQEPLPLQVMDDPIPQMNKSNKFIGVPIVCAVSKNDDPKAGFYVLGEDINGPIYRQSSPTNKNVIRWSTPGRWIWQNVQSGVIYGESSTETLPTIFPNIPAIHLTADLGQCRGFEGVVPLDPPYSTPEELFPNLTPEQVAILSTDVCRDACMRFAGVCKYSTNPQCCIATLAQYLRKNDTELTDMYCPRILPDSTPHAGSVLTGVYPPDISEMESEMICTADDGLLILQEGSQLLGGQIRPAIRAGDTLRISSARLHLKRQANGKYTIAKGATMFIDGGVIGERISIDSGLMSIAGGELSLRTCGDKFIVKSSPSSPNYLLLDNWFVTASGAQPGSVEGRQGRLLLDSMMLRCPINALEVPRSRAQEQPPAISYGRRATAISNENTSPFAGIQDTQATTTVGRLPMNAHPRSLRSIESKNESDIIANANDNNNEKFESTNEINITEAGLLGGIASDKPPEDIQFTCQFDSGTIVLSPESKIGECEFVGGDWIGVSYGSLVVAPVYKKDGFKILSGNIEFNSGKLFNEGSVISGGVVLSGGWVPAPYINVTSEGVGLLRIRPNDLPQSFNVKESKLVTEKTTCEDTDGDVTKEFDIIWSEIPITCVPS